MLDDDGDEIEEDEELGEIDSDPMTSRAAFKDMIIKVLEENELDQKRASKMEILDFLTLLNALNEKGVHFS